MDPFSITVGAIGLAGAAKKATGGIIKRLKALRDAPEELQDLLAELAQFEEIFSRIQDITYSPGNQDSTLQALLCRANDKILELDSLIEYRLTRAGTSDKVDRRQWVESQKDIDRLLKQLINIRANLSVIFAASTSSNVQHILELMPQVHSNTLATATALNCLPEICREVQSIVSAVTGIQNNFPRLTLEPSHSDPKSMGDSAHSSVSHFNRDTASGALRRRPQLQRPYQTTYCHSNCPCKCHYKYIFWDSWRLARNVRPLARVFGRTYVERKGSSWTGASCDLQSCKRTAVSQLRVIYFVPTWFAMKAIYIRYTSSPLHGPEWLIRIPRLVTGQNSGRLAVSKNDLPWFRAAIASGECTPYDIYEDGSSILEKILRGRAWEFVSCLVVMGVDFCQTLGTEQDTLDLIWSEFVRIRYRVHLDENMGKKWFLPDLIPSFPLDEYIEKEGFHVLHEIVCCFNHCDLDSAIQNHLADINKLNNKGKSPLEMAIRWQDEAAVRTLLKRGADPNISNGGPLCAALENTVYHLSVLVDLLLRSGATVHDPAGQAIAATWFSYSYIAGPETKGLAIDRLLIEHGLDVNYQVEGRTLLMKLCQHGAEDRVEQLIGFGADLELKNFHGYTALHYAVCYTNLVAMKALFRAGSRLQVNTNEGSTIAHLAVICSKTYLIPKTMSEIDLRTLDLDFKNEDGHTAYDLLRKRNGLRWESYHSKWYKSIHESHNFIIWHDLPRSDPEYEYETILALEILLHLIQDSQGVPKDQQYPPLGEYLSDDTDEEPVPGAWPL